MSTAVLTAPAFARPGLGRLTLVELRKMTDTRSGFWLLVATALVTVAAAVVAVFVLQDADSTLVNFTAVAMTPPSLLMPVAGILLVTSEWSQRTAMITFALVPQRWRVLVAKLLAGIVLALVALAVGLVVALIATSVAGGDGPATWSMSAGIVGQAAVSVTVPMLIGIAFGAVLLTSAPAIVLYYLLPTVWSVLGEIPALEDPARWLDTSRTMMRLVEYELSATEWARVGTSLVLWLLVPMVLGFWRVLRSDVR